MEHLSIEILKEHILPYVGKDQFRFVGGVNRTFCSAYTAVYSHRTKYQYIKTLKLFQFCFADMPNKTKEQCWLFQRAAQLANLEILQYLQSVGCSCDEQASQAALQNKHCDLEVLLFWYHKSGNMNL
jgi:hypothetical protein